MTKVHPPQQQAIRPTPFHGAAAACSLTNAWRRWGDYTIADVYTTVDQEYDALRQHAGLMDLSPLRKIHVSGADAQSFLNRLLTRNVAALALRRSCNSVFCDDAGHVIGLAHLLRLNVDKYEILTEENHATWFWNSSAGYENLHLEVVTHEQGIVGLFGKRATDILAFAGISGAGDLDISAHDSFMVQRVKLRVMKTTSLGETGYFLSVDPKDALFIWELLMRAGQSHGAAPVGWRAQDICRIESGMLRAGTDFIGANDACHGNRPRTPYELGLADSVDLEKDHFVGLRALTMGVERPGRTCQVGLRVEGVEPITGGRILRQDQLIGVVTSSAWSPRLGYVVALATVTGGHEAPGQDVEVEYSTLVELEPQIWSLKAQIIEKPFYNNTL